MRPGWSVSPLGELCSFQRGLTYRKSDEAEYSNNAVLRANNIDVLTGKLNLDEIRYISDSVAVPPEMKVRRGAVLVCTASGSRSHLGKATYVDGDYRYAFGGFMGQLSPKHTLSGKYLFYLMQTTAYRDFIGGLSASMNINNLRYSDLAHFKIPHPPLQEQERIIALLDKTFEGVDTAKVNASKVLAGSIELFESRVAEVFSARGESWKQQRLADVCSDITVGHVGSMIKEYRDDGVPFLRSQNIRPFHISLENIVYIDAAFNKTLKKSQLRPGDLAIVRTGYPGTAAVIPLDLPVSNCSDLVIVRPGPSLNSFYMAHFFNSIHGKRLVLGNLVGSAQKHFNIGSAKSVLVPIPPLQQQQHIVSMLDEFRAEVRRLEHVQLQKLASFEALKQSFLRQAFSGNFRAIP